MNIRADVLRIINKVVGNVSYLEVSFFDNDIISSLQQIDYFQKKYGFSGLALEFIDVKTSRDLYERVRSKSAAMKDDYLTFCIEIFLKFSVDILRSRTFTKEESLKIVEQLSAGMTNRIIVEPDTLDKVLFSKLYSEVLKSIRKGGIPAIGGVNENELKSRLTLAVYRVTSETILDTNLPLLNLTKKGNEVIHFLSSIEKVFEIRVPYSEVGKLNIFTSVYKWLQFQRPGNKFTKESIEQEIMTIAARVFGDSNLLTLLDMTNFIERKYDITISKSDLLSSIGVKSFIALVARSLKEQKPQLTAAMANIEDRVRDATSEYFAEKEMSSDRPDDEHQEDNKFIEDIEKRFNIRFATYDLMQLQNLNSIVTTVERLVRTNRVAEKFPGLLPSVGPLSAFIKSEIFKLASENTKKNESAMMTDLGAVDAPKKIDSMRSIEIVVQLENAFGIKIPQDMLYLIETPDQIVALVEKLVAEKESRLLPPEQKGGGDITDKL